MVRSVASVLVELVVIVPPPAGQLNVAIPPAATAASRPASLHAYSAAAAYGAGISASNMISRTATRSLIWRAGSLSINNLPNRHRLDSRLPYKSSRGLHLKSYEYYTTICLYDKIEWSCKDAP